uniref:G-protein coupled receptors family 1 profile domain-containing protein n=1 Tax=Oreochromis niloticus TaxID=8128 RepID=A0A669DKJ1_ORENI
FATSVMDLLFAISLTTFCFERCFLFLSFYFSNYILKLIVIQYFLNMSLQNNASIKLTHFIIGGFDTVKRPVALGVVMLIAYLLAVTGSLVNIIFIVSDKQLHKPMYLLICNLAVVDILYTSSSTPTMIQVLLAGVNTISYVECLIQMCVFQLGGIMERFTLTIMCDSMCSLSSNIVNGVK